MTQAGYYDYAPTVSLARPVAFVGHPGCAYREVAYDLAALTGLPLHDVDRLVEHAAGQTLWSLVRQRGDGALSQLEGGVVPRCLTARPPGLVVLGEGALVDEQQLARVRAAAALVFLTLPAPACYWALRRRAAARDGILGHPYLPDRLEDPADLRALLGLMAPALRAADCVVDMERRGVHEAVLELQSALPALGASAPAPRRGR